MGLSLTVIPRHTLAKVAFLAIVAALLALYWPKAADPNAASTDVANCRITHVVDGDTVDLKCEGRQTERIRVMGYDTPETYYADCPAEKRLGDEATERVRRLAASAPVTRVERKGTDRYDRTLARIWIGGTDLAETMVSEGLALRYNGGTRIDWCDPNAQPGNN